VIEVNFHSFFQLINLYLARNNDTTDSVTTTTVTRTPTEDRLRDKIAVITVGILTMCAYAYLSGLIRIEISQVE
jgi:hypothetical protein